MRRFRGVLGLLVLLGAAVAACAQVPAEVRVPVGRLAAVPIDTGGRAFAFEVLGDLDVFREFTEEPGKVRLRLIGYQSGTHWLVVALASEKGPPTLHRTRILVGESPTPPTPPPGPGPKPEPPQPDPKPPKPASGFKVLILEETADRSKLPPAQLAVLFSRQVRDWLDQHCSLEPDGKTRTWTIQDQDTDLSTYFPGWSDLAKASRRNALPWIVLADGAGRIVHEAPLPATVAATLELLGRFAPAKGGRP